MLRLTITTRTIILNERLEKYTHKKIDALERYVPRSARAATQAQVRLKQTTLKGVHKSTCSITLQLPHETLQASETTQHLYAALDIAAAHIRDQLRSYKATHHPAALRSRFKRPDDGQAEP